MINSAFTNELLAFIDEQISRSPEQRAAQDATLAAEDRRYMTMPSISWFERDGTPDKILTPEILDRVIVCPKINRDLTDGWGMYGTEPGFILVEAASQSRRGANSYNESTLLEGTSLYSVPGIRFPVLPHWDSFPYLKFEFTIFSPSHNDYPKNIAVKKVAIFNYLKSITRLHALKGPNRPADDSQTIQSLEDGPRRM